jgi:hypothetical protein
MTITTEPKKTVLQETLENELLFLNADSLLPEGLVSAVEAYVDIVNTPTFSDLVNLIASFENEKIAIIDTNSISLTLVNALENIVLREFYALKIGSPVENAILVDYQYPLDDGRVTYSSILANLITNLSVPTNVDTVAHLAGTIFYTVNALNPQLNLADLTADIQATVDSGASLTDLVSNIITSLGNINTATYSTITEAVYGNNIFTSDAAKFVTDINEKEAELNFNEIKTNLIAACNDSSTDNSGFAAAIFGSLIALGSHDHLLKLARIVRDVNAGVAEAGSLATLKATIKGNLEAINSSTLAANFPDALADAVFTEGGLIPSDPHDLSIDLPPANALLGLQYIREALINALTDFDGNAVELANIISSTVADQGGGTSLSEAELTNDIEASGDLSALVSSIFDNLGALNPNTLTASGLVSAFYGAGLIISGHKQNLIDDLTTRQIILNYTAMKEALADAILGATSAAELADAIYDNIGSTPALSKAAILADITATLAATDLSSLKTALATALGNAEPTAAAIDAALYGPGLIISADPSAATLDVNTAETAIDYRSLISNLKDVCDQVDDTTISTPEQFVQALKDTLYVFAGTTATLNKDNVVNSINFNIANHISEDLTTIAADIKASLTLAANNHDYTSMAIDAAIFNHIDPSHPTRLHEDAEYTEQFKNLLDIKTSIISACDTVDVNTTPNAFAQALIAAVVNDTDMTPTLQLDELKADIIATIAANSMLIITLADNIKSNLNAIANNALTDAGIKNALYNTNNALISANPYEMGLDIEAASIILGYKDIKQSLITYLETINTEGTDVSSINMAKGILNALDVVTSDHSNYKITPVHLNADISYTISQNQDAFGLGCYQLAEVLVTRLGTAENSPSGIMDALFDAAAIIPSNGNAGANLSDEANLVMYITAINGDLTEYDIIRDAIVSNLSALTGVYNSEAVATAIFNGIGAASPHLSIADLQANIDATSGTLASIVGSLIEDLSHLDLTQASGTDATDIVNVIFAAGGGVLTSSKVNANNLVSDIDTSMVDTNDYQAIIDKIVSNLEALTDPYNENDVAVAIATGLDYIDGVAILNPSLTTARLLDDVNKTVPSTVDSLPLLVSNLINTLVDLTGNDVSASGIQGAIFNVGRGTLSTAITDADIYNSDLQAAAAAHSSLAAIKVNFASVGTYADSAALATAILNKIVSGSYITTSLTLEKLTADIDHTLTNNPSLTLSTLASSVFADVYGLSSDATTADIVNAIFGDNIQTTYNADLLKQDLANYEASRESTFYGDIINTWKDNFEYSPMTAADFANRAVDTLALTSPQWTAPRITSDLNASIFMGLSERVRAGLNNVTADGIADVIYAPGNVALSTVDADALTSDVGAYIPLYGGATGIAAKVKAALEAFASSGEYDENDVATAIIETITPSAVNLLPNLSVANMAVDLLFTINYPYDGPATITEIVDAIKRKLDTVITNPLATAADLDAAIYSRDTIIPSDSDRANFELDLSNSTALYNDFDTIRTALENVASVSSTAAAESVVTTALGLESPNFTVLALIADIEGSIVTTLADLVDTISNRVENADISNRLTAARNLADAFFHPSALISVDSVNLATDITAAKEIDDFVSLVSVVGAGVCREGASHTVYRCTMSNDVATVGAPIATNDCTLAGVNVAEKACDAWASQSGTDFYVSYNGETCSGYLQNPASACKNGLDYLAD